jgi:maleate cis-trans isomerase
MSLNMNGQIDAVFSSVPVVHIVNNTGAYVDGLWVEGTELSTPYTATVQPATDREIDFLSQGGERLTDVRKLYINEGNMQGIDNTGDWEILGQRFKTIKTDNRYWRDYCKVFVSRYDEQPE